MNRTFTLNFEDPMENEVTILESQIITIRYSIYYKLNIYLRDGYTYHIKPTSEPYLGDPELIKKSIFEGYQILKAFLNNTSTINECTFEDYTDIYLLKDGEYISMDCEK